MLKPWQMTFFIVGLPGVLIAGLFYLTIRDPERRGISNTRGFPIREIGSYIFQHKKTFISHFLGFGFLALSLFAILSWAPAFLSRKYSLEIKEVGYYLGSVVLVSNTAGVLCSGMLTDFFTRRGYEDAPMRSGMIGGLGAILPAALFSFMPGLNVTMLVLTIAMFFASFPLATSAAALQLMAPNQMRAQVTALFFISLNVLGITGGSFLVAVCTDYVFKEKIMVGYSMSLVSASAAVIGAILLYWGLKHFSATAVAISSNK